MMDVTRNVGNNHIDSDKHMDLKHWKRIINTVSSITRVSALKIKSEKRAESGQRIATKAVTKAAADAEDDSDSNADSEDDKI